MEVVREDQSCYWCHLLHPSVAINQSSSAGVCCTRSVPSSLTLAAIAIIIGNAALRLSLPCYVHVRFGTSAPTEYLLVSYIITKSGDNVNILVIYCI